MTAIGVDWKGKMSPWLYVAGVGLAFVSPAIAELLCLLVASGGWFPIAG